MKDIENKEDVKNLVDTFYGKVQKDELIGPIFIGIIGNNWPAHLEKMYSFWGSILLDEHSYHGRPFLPHAPLPLQKEHFDRWLTLFHHTLDTLYEGEIADIAKLRSNNIARMFLSKIEFIRENTLRK